MDCCGKPQEADNRKKRKQGLQAEPDRPCRFPKHEKEWEDRTPESLRRDMYDELEACKKKYQEATREYLQVLTGVTESLFQETMERLDTVSKRYADLDSQRRECTCSKESKNSASWTREGSEFSEKNLEFQPVDPTGKKIK